MKKKSLSTCCTNTILKTLWPGFAGTGLGQVAGWEIVMVLAVPDISNLQTTGLVGHSGSGRERKVTELQNSSYCIRKIGHD